MRIVTSPERSISFLPLKSWEKKTLSLDMQVKSRRKPMTGLTMEHEHQLKCLRVCQLSHSP